MKSWEELGLSRLYVYGAMIYTMYKAGLLTEEQIIKLRNMPNYPSNPEEVFKIIDEAFK